MIVLITGGSGSGKSAYAEEYTAQISGDSLKYYLATMQVYDKEGQERVERHRRQRSGKGFLTIEQQSNICEALEKMEISGQTALLECMSNLVANEMFSDETQKSCEAVTDKIIKEIGLLGRGLKNLVIVSNNVFEDGTVYDDTTMEYMRAMGSVNEKLAVMADKVVEIVVGIPLTIKEGK